MSNNTVLVVAPHADDETFGCAGTILNHLLKGDSVHWLLITQMSEEQGFTPEQIQQRHKDIESVSSLLGFESVTQLSFPPAKLDIIPKSDIVQQIGVVMDEITPSVVYLPFRNDVHSDHEVVFDTTVACCKSFRRPFIHQILAYETQSETDFTLKPGTTAFSPNYYVDISKVFDKKIDAVAVYKSEIAAFPFPRSIEAVKALAMLRGTQAGVNFAESFMLLKQIIK